MEWSELVASAATGAPYIGQVLEDAFRQAQAVVVLFTPDETCRLREGLVPPDDPDGEGDLRGQSRPNVFLEAGMALATFPARTVLTELGSQRKASDLSGRHIVRLNPGAECRKDLAQRLQTAGCLVNLDGDDWMSAGDFTVDRGLTPPAEEPADTRAPETLALMRRIDALYRELEPVKGYVLLGVAQVYNALLDEAGAGAEFPRLKINDGGSRVDGMGNPARVTMRGDEMRVHLSQLRERLS